jgi:hypothetical protein
MELDLDADFMLELGQTVKATHEHVKSTMQSDRPIRKPIGGSLVLPPGFSGSGPVLLQLEASPAHGRCWNLLKAGVFGVDTHTAVASVNADIFAGDTIDTTNATNFLDCVVSGATVPSITNFGRKTEWCYSGQYVYALIYGSGLSAGQPYELIVRIAEYATNDVEASRVP